jgi:hypothetical protein
LRLAAVREDETSSGESKGARDWEMKTRSNGQRVLSDEVRDFPSLSYDL